MISYREVHNSPPGGLIILKVQDVRLIPAPAVRYERHANSAALEKSPRSHLICMLQTRGELFGSHCLELHE